MFDFQPLQIFGLPFPFSLETQPGVLAASGQRDTHSIPLLVEWLSLCFSRCNSLPSVLSNLAWLRRDGYMYGDGAGTHYCCCNPLCSSEWRTLKSLNVAEVSGKFFLWRSFSWEEFTYGTGSFEIQSFACSTVKCGYREWFCTGNVEWLRSLLTILWTHLLSILDLSHHGCAWKCGRSPGKKNQSQPPKLAAGASVIASVSETNSSPLKMDGWNTTFLLWRPIFRGHVSFREGNVLTSIFLPPNGGSMLHENAQRHQWIWRFELDSQSSRRRCQCLVCTEWHWSGFFFGESLCYSCCHYHFSLKSFKPYGDSCGFAPRQIQVPCKTVSWI